MFTYHPFIDSYLSGSNSQHSMSYFHNEDTVLLNNKGQGILPTTMLAPLVIHNSFTTDVI